MLLTLHDSKDVRDSKGDRTSSRQRVCLRPMKNNMVGITENSMRILLSQIDFECFIISGAIPIPFITSTELVNV